MLKEKDAVVNEAVSVMKEVDKIMKFDGNNNTGRRGTGFGMKTNKEEGKGKKDQIRVLETGRVAK